MLPEGDWVGTTSDVRTFRVEQGHIERFAEAIGDPNPIYRDDDYASNSPYRGTIAPPTFATTFRMSHPLLEHEDFELGRVLHGEQEFDYERPLRPGETVWCQSTITEIDERTTSGGTMSRILMEITVTDANRKTVLVSRRTLLYRHQLQED